jgi:hypothetical protein
MKKRYVLTIVLAVILLLSIIVPTSIFVLKELEKSSARTRYESDVSYVIVSVRDALKRYYKNNGRYPEKLTELPDLGVEDVVISNLGFTNKNELLSKFSYKAADAVYELQVNYIYGTELKTRKEFGEKGQLVAWAFYRNGRLYRKEAFSDVEPNIGQKYLEEKFMPQTISYSDAKVISQKRNK